MRSGFWVMVSCVMMVTMALSGCGSTKLFGSQTPPDETQVIDGPSLSLPPDFSLRPPHEAEDYEAVLRAQKTREAEAIIIGGPVSATIIPGVATDDQWLLQQAGVADANIRDKLTADEAEPDAEDANFWNRILGKDKK